MIYHPLFKIDVMDRFHNPFVYSLILAFLFWFLPFVVRLCIIDIQPVDAFLFNNLLEGVNMPGENTVLLLSEGNNKGAFWNILATNLKGCLLNVLGGTLLGLGTIINLAYNGFVMADMIVFSHNSGMSWNMILKLNLPHCFELIGFWVSGGMGFYYAWQIICFIRQKENFTSSFYIRMGRCTVIFCLIILFAAYVESYITGKFV